MKRIGRTFLLLVLALALTAPAALAWGSQSVAEQYAAACDLLQDGKYTEAAAAFTALGGYSDAPRYAMYCAAVAAGNEGMYATAVTNLSTLTGFLDSDLLAVYYTALSHEAAENYEKAQELLSLMTLYRDSSDRLAGYPAKILARDYARADQYEQSGQLEMALSAFRALDGYKDSSARAAAVQEKILARDYAAAAALEDEGKLEEALAAFKALGTYSDAPARVAGVEEKILAREYAAAAALENEGKLEEALAAFIALADYSDAPARADIIREKILVRDYDAAAQFEADGEYVLAYDMFIALGDFRDSADRAAAVQQRAEYARGLAAIANRKYHDAYVIFTALGDYEDAAQKAYILGINNFAGFSNIQDGLVQFSFHNRIGIANLYENVTMAPQWTDFKMLTSEHFRAYSDSWCLMDIHGNVVIPGGYYFIDRFSNGMYYAYTMTKGPTNYTIPAYSLFTAEGAKVMPETYGRISPFTDSGLCIVAQADKEASSGRYTYYDFALMNDQGQLLSRFYDHIVGVNNYYHYTTDSRGSVTAPVFYDGRLLVQSETLYGFIDESGSEVIPAKYADAWSFSNGYAAVKDAATGLWGYIDVNGSLVIPFLYDSVTNFTQEGLADVCLQGSWQIINARGELIYFK